MLNIKLDFKPLTVRLCFVLEIKKSLNPEDDSSNEDPQIDAVIEQLEHQLGDEENVKTSIASGIETGLREAFHDKLAAFIAAEKIIATAPTLSRTGQKITIALDASAEDGTKILNWFVRTKGGTIDE